MARLLIIDDDASFAELTARRLATGGHQVDVREEATGVLTDVRQGGYDLLLIDVNMPVVSGPRLMDALAARDRGRLKLAFMSSLDPSELAALARKHKADGWISKSASRSELLSKIDLLLLSHDDGPRHE